MLDFVRVAAVVPDVFVGDVVKNTDAILAKARQAMEKSPHMILFPELAMTGYTCADLFFQQALLDSALQELAKLLQFSKKVSSVLMVGLPLRIDGALYSCAAVISRGRLWGIVPKTYLPTYNEFYERRWFSSASDCKTTELSAASLGIEAFQNEAVPIGYPLVFDCGMFTFGVEICEDLWATIPPSSVLALQGAEVIFNLSASNETIAKRIYRRQLVMQQSAAQLGAYVYVSAGCTESTTDLIFSGHSLVCENGKLLAENEKSIDSNYILFAEIDLGKIRADRLKNKTYAQSRALCSVQKRVVHLPAPAPLTELLFYPVDPHPFVPADVSHRQQRCSDIFEMQVMALKKRIECTASKPVIGISGGLDSTLALLVTVEAMRRCGKKTSDVVGITMPCFGTTDRTYGNALSLMKALHVTCVEIPIRAAVQQHFSDIGHDGTTPDLTFENAQARERTQILMDYANRIGGFVVGTGDLSELALGWCTYNADHMSMYGVNAGVPKTLVRWMIDSLLCSDMFSACKEILLDILATPISPELLPPDSSGDIAQQTEQIVGPYVLHDFFLYYVVRFGFTPKKIFLLACRAFADMLDRATIQKWLVVFYQRFFSQQFKRSCLPDGVKIGSICLSPRGDWRMPSDATATLWLEQARSITP
ncbi:MAG: NAD(+) synthase [Eubacteriales bacterium]|nr:NAD(+) synthase [Eubacteriales bacterium]